jgi:hypothetical protein
MTSESKILTVSYGTFSCTLEGFDNPFDTMKAIAEYFRDLAAQDRHFGAEPPPPDAAMLHRLAEREVSRLATTKAEESARLHLTPESSEAPVAPRIQINPVNRRPAHPPVEAEAEVAAQTPAEPSLQDVIPDGVAAKLARIRRSVHPTVAEAAAPQKAFVAEAPVEQDELADTVAFVSDELATDPVDAADVAADLPEAAFDAADTASDDVAARLGALIADGPSAPDYEVEDAVDAVDLSADDSWTPAEIPVVAEAAAEDFDATSLVDAEADLATALADDEFSAFTGAALNEDDLTSEDVALLAQLDGTVFDEASLAAELDDTLPEQQPDDLDLSEAAMVDPLPELSEADLSADALPEELEAFAPAAELEVEPEVEPEMDAPKAADAVAYQADAPMDAATDVVAAAVVEEDAPTAKAGARTRRVNSRVVRIHPSEEAPGAKRDVGATRVLDDADDSDEISRLMQQAEEVMAEDENRRRQEALSRLKAAVVATEADRADIDYEAPKADANLDPYRDDLAEAIQPDLAPEPQPEPEVKPTRRKSVMIRPASEPRPGTIRPGMISPPPLVLVSEQRIDRVGPAVAPIPAPAPAAAPAMSPPVPGIGPSEGQPMVALRTGRLTGAIGVGSAVAASGMPARNLVLEKPSYGTAAETEEDEDLAEDSKEIDESALASFAETVGARSMAEMLEAAAAYATCVEKRSHFTRPQLMRRMMASAGGKPVSREDGLRSFGTLLRTGRIEKVTRGHYSLAENSPYLAEARRLS